MKLYNTEKELSFSDRKTLPNGLIKLSMPELIELSENLGNAIENAFLYGNDLLSLALDMDKRKLDIVIAMKEKQEKRKCKTDP